MSDRNKSRFGLGRFRRPGDYRNEKESKLSAKEMWPVSDVAMVHPAARRPDKATGYASETHATANRNTSKE